MNKEDVMILDGTLSLKVKSLQISDEPIWSANTGRTTDGVMRGDIVAWKKTLQTTFCPMTAAEASSLGTITKKSTYTVEFIDPNTGVKGSIVAYATPVRYTAYNYTVAKPYIDTTVTFTER